jgi:hypothetical protein
VAEPAEQITPVLTVTVGRALTVTVAVVKLLQLLIEVPVIV